MPKLTFQTPWQKHQVAWLNCQLCGYCKTRRRVCLARGSLPCDVLFIGEAPGPSEDVLGMPFTGPAGHLLDKAIKDTGVEVVRLCFTNLVACIPVNPEENKKFDEPGELEIKACAPRLKELVRIAKPRAIVNVGQLARKHVYGQAQFSDFQVMGKKEFGTVPWLRDDELIEFVEIVHPAAILRADVAQQGLAYQRVVVQLRDLFQQLRSK